MLAVLLTDAQSLLAECCVRSTYPRHPLLVVGARDLGSPLRGSRPLPHYTEDRFSTVTGLLSSLPGLTSVPARRPYLSIPLSVPQGVCWRREQGSSESSLYARLAQARSLGAQGSVRIRIASRQRYQVCRPRSSSKPRTARG